MSDQARRVARRIGEATAPAKLKTVRVGDVAPESLRWLWEPRIARGKLSLIAGDPGLGKSLVTLAMATTVSVGGRWPGDGTQAPLGAALMLSDEDDVADTIRPRLDAAGADVTRIHAVTFVEGTDETGQRERRAFSLQSDVELLADRLDRLPQCRLVVVDPVSAYLGSADSHKNAEVRAVLSGLADIARRYGVAVVAVTHLNKGSASANYRITGSIAFTAAPRAAYLVVADQDDARRRLMLPVKNNLGDDTHGFAYRIGTAENGAPVVEWEPDLVEADLDAMLAPRGDDAERSALDDAAEWLTSELSHGPVATAELQRSARAAGHAWRTVRRAKDRIGVLARRTAPGGGWEWWHPGDATPPDGQVH